MLDIIYLLCIKVNLSFLSWQPKFQYLGRKGLVITYVQVLKKKKNIL